MNLWVPNNRKFHGKLNSNYSRNTLYHYLVLYHPLVLWASHHQLTRAFIHSFSCPSTPKHLIQETQMDTLTSQSTTQRILHRRYGELEGDTTVTRGELCRGGWTTITCLGFMHDLYFVKEYHYTTCF